MTDAMTVNGRYSESAGAQLVSRLGSNRQSCRAYATKARQAADPNTSMLPLWFLLSRTDTQPGRLSATSMQAPPLVPGTRLLPLGAGPVRYFGALLRWSRD